MIKKKTIKQYKEFIQKCIDKYQDKLCLSSYTIVIRETKEHYLACQYRYPYNDGIILFSQQSYKDWLEEPNSYHERKILHELCHLITDPFYTKATTQYTSRSEIEDERERLTDTIAVIVSKLVGERVE